MAIAKPLKVRAFDAAQYLNDEATIAEYLNACLELGDPAVLLNAIGDVAKAKGMAELARKAGVGRESLYKALSPGAHPRYDTVFKVTQALGVTLRFETAASEKRELPNGAKQHAKRARRVSAEVRATARANADAPRKSPKKATPTR